MNTRTVTFASGRTVEFRAPVARHGPRWLYDETKRCAGFTGISKSFEHQCVRDARKGSRLCSTCAKRRGLK